MVVKVLLYTEGMKTIGVSGLGKAIEHQKKALTDASVSYTTNRSEEYDILHINTWFIKSYFVAKRAKRKGKKIVYHAHSTEEDYRNGFILANQTSKLIKWWLIKCYSLGDVIVTPTEYSKKLLENYRGLENKKIYAISNGIELDFFKRKKGDRKSFRERYGYQEEDKVIISIGLYIRRKGIVDFVELARRLPEYKFIWFGESPLLAATEDVRKAVNTTLPNLKFAGHVEQELIREALGGCDLYLFPTYEETEGIPIIEATIMKRDAIIRDIPIFEEFEDKKSIYKAKDVDEFEVLIKKFFTGELPSLVDEAYTIAKKRDIKEVGKELKKVYEELMEEDNE